MPSCRAGPQPQEGWSLPAVSCLPSGPPVPSQSSPISSRSSSRHPARPPGPLHGAVHKVSGLSERKEGESKSAIKLINPCRKHLLLNHRGVRVSALML